MVRINRPDPVRIALNDVLTRLEAGEPIDERVERQCLDLKEEAGRRDRKGQILKGQPQNEKAAEQLAKESACMANTKGGGALIVGVADDGSLVGTELDEEWLRRRIYELTQRRLTVDVRAMRIRGERLITIIAPQALEPVRWKGKIQWRVGDACVEIDASTWHAEQMARRGYDESAQPSQISAERVSPAALAFVRDTLRESGDEKSLSLLEATDAQLLRRLGAVTSEDMLTQAAALFFVGREEPMIDYVYREYSGGDSLVRVQQRGRSLAETLKEVLLNLDSRNPVTHLHGSAGIGQTRAIPPLAAREAIVNAVAHRDWQSPEPTFVEHVGATLKVTSPGGFYGGVNERNILTHPSTSRNRALTQLLASVKLAEREGIGVDRMIAHMLRSGLVIPEIVEIDGPMVRTTLLGGSVDKAWLRWLSGLTPTHMGRDVNALLVFRRLLETGWIDVERAAPLLQVGPTEAQGVLEALEGCKNGKEPVFQRVDGVPLQAEPAWCLHPHAVAALDELDRQEGTPRKGPTREHIAYTYAQARGRISSTELASMTGSRASNIGRVLKSLAQQGLLEGSSESGRGQGFHFRWVGAS